MLMLLAQKWCYYQLLGKHKAGWFLNAVVNDALSLRDCYWHCRFKGLQLWHWQFSSWPCLGDIIQHSQLPTHPFPKDVFLPQVCVRDQEQQAWPIAIKRELCPSSSKMVLLKLQVPKVLKMNVFLKIHPHLFTPRGELQQQQLLWGQIFASLNSQ